jgi:hypothetical protein
LSMNEVQRRHATSTLAQIAARQHVALAHFTRTLGTVVDNYATSLFLFHYATHAEASALQRAYHRTIDALMQARAGTPLAPLLGDDADIARLPHGSPAAPAGTQAGREQGQRPH